MFTWCMAAIILSYAFTSSLIAGLSVQLRIDPPETWAELLESDYVIKMFTNGNDKPGMPIGLQIMVGLG